MSSKTSTQPPAPDSVALTSLPPHVAVWRVAWPMVALGLLKSAYFLTDSYFVGKLGDKQLAALGGAAFAWWMIWIASDLAGIGTHTLSSRHEGAQRRDRIPGTLTQGMYVGVIVSVALIVAAWPIRHLYFDLLGFERGTAEYLFGSEFLGASLLGASTLVLFQVVGSVFRGVGHTRTVLAISAVTLVLNAALDPVLIWGWGLAPELGIAGAAWATSAANGVGVLVGLVVLARRGLGPSWLGPAAATVRTIFKIGLPVAASGTGFSLVYVLLGRFINDFGTEHMAGLGVGHRLESLGYMFSVGMMVGAATMVGQHLGARRPDLAAASAHAAAWICSAGLIPMSVALWLAAPTLFDVFTDDPATAVAGVHYLRIQLLVMTLMGIEVVYEGGFSGAGDTMPTFWISFVLTGARIPLAWLLAYPLGWGIGGVWWAIAASTAVKGVVMWAWFRRGNWVDAVEPDEIEEPAMVPAISEPV